MPDFDDFIDQLRNELVNRASELGDEVKDDLIKDGKTFAKEAEDDLKRWTQLMAEGKLTKQDLEFLVNGKKDLAKMEALKHKGLAKAKLDQYKSAIVDSVITSATKLFV
jgi:transcription initiation factor IIF auxiliary subunit